MAEHPGALEATRRELGLADAAPIAALSVEQLAELRELVRTAKAQQRASLATAIEHALDVVPRLLRGAVRRVLFP